MERLTVLIIDDEQRYIDNIKDRLKRFQRFYQFECLTAQSGTEGLHQAQTNHVDLIFLDILMEDEEAGFRVLEGLREERRTRAIPVIIRSVTADRARGYATIKRGLALNALWILGKDLPIDVLDSYIEHALQFIENQHPERRDVSSWPLNYDHTTGRLWVDGKLRTDLSNRLTHQQRRFLTLLCEQPGVICTRDEVAQFVFEEDDPGTNDETRIDQLIHRLRALLSDEVVPHRYIVTVRSEGFRLKLDPEPDELF